MRELYVAEAKANGALSCSFVVAACLLVGCSGAISNDSERGEGSGGENGGGAGGGATFNGECKAPRGPTLQRRVWRLTSEQVVRTLDSVPEFSKRDGANISLRDPTDGLFVNQPQTLRLDYPDRFPTAEAFMTGVANRAVAAIKARGGCADLSRACLGDFYAERLARLWRRPTDPNETNALLSVYDQIAGANETKVKYSLLTALLSPSFWYRTELGDQQETGHLTPAEMASFLSYGITNGPPDDVLWADVVSGKLRSAESLGKHARRLVDGGKQTTALTAFFRDWLDYKKIDAMEQVGTLKMTDEVKSALQQELALFVEERAGKGADFGSYFTESKIYPNKDTAGIYDISSTSLRPTMQSADPDRRMGLLTLAGSLVATSRQSQDHNYIYRGASFLAKFACAATPPPPANITSGIKPGDDLSGLSSKQIKLLHSSAPSCAGCHATLDPVGLVFEGYDMMGKWRAADDNGPIDTSGSFAVGDDEFKFKDLPEFLRQFSSSERFVQCGTARLVGYVTGSAVNVDDSLEDMGFTGCAGKPVNLSDALVAIYSNDKFLQRSE